MDLEHRDLNNSDQPRRRRRNAVRRRMRNRAPISARLSLDPQLRGNVGVVSEDLAGDLFHNSTIEGIGKETDIHYIAISPFLPGSNAVEDLAWTIIPVRPQSKERSSQSPLPHNTVLFPHSATSLQPFTDALSKLDPTRHTLQAQRPIEIQLLDVAPLPLDTIYVTVERNLLRNHDDVQNKFGGGFTPSQNGPNGHWAKGGKGGLDAKKQSKKVVAETEDRLTAAVRHALGAEKVVHTGDVLPLPLPPHPITYAPSPPARISYCEPVSQGLLMPTTKVVLIQARPQGHRSQRSLRSSSGLLKQVAEDEADDTSNEQFYSAAEDKPVESSTEVEATSTADESETEGSGNASDTSDDSLDDMISLAAPELPQPPSGVMSAMTAATPRAGGRRGDGTHTPGSVASNFTSTTMRPGKTNGGKVFKAEGLLRRVSSDLLHPRPREDDDTESFIFVDISTLAKIGCFSGDWVRIEATEEPQLNMFASIKLGSFNEQEEDSGNWRAAKIYGLPGLPSAKPRYSINQSGERRSSISQRAPTRLTPSVFVPPLLLNNLENPKYLRISPITFAGANGVKPGLLHQVKSSVVRSPPLAKEVTLLKVSTPLSMDRVLQPALFAGLKQYFESKRRLLKGGDLVGISVDEGLGRAVFPVTTGGDTGAQDDDLTNRLGQVTDTNNTASKKVGVAWFRVGQVIPSTSSEQDGSENQWGGVAVIDSATTRMVQAGSDVSRVPGTINNGWEYWLGVKAVPRAANDAPTPHGLITETPQSFIPPLQQRIRDLMAVATSPRAIQLGMKPVVILIRSQQRHIGKATIANRACADIGLHTFPIDAYDILTEGGANGGDVKTEAYLKARAERAFHCGPECTALLIKHIEVLTADRIISAMADIVADARVVIATTTDVEQIPEGIRSMFTHEFEMTAPEEKEREGILRNAVTERGIKTSPDVDLSTVALKTAALVAGDLVDVVERASAARTARLEKLAELASKNAGQAVSVRDVLVSGGDAARGVTKVDFDAAVDAARKNFADSIGAPKIPNVSWDDVGGLTNVKDALIETIQLPLERPELFAKGMKKRSGILFYGPPGTGKTLLAKAIATEFSLNFFSVKGPELLNMYIGESEANVRRVFQRARDARPCVVFFDELDSVAPKRGNQGDSGGVMDRIVSQLLAELDGMNGGEENSGGVFVIGATNRPDLLDTALLRPGRFDKMLYLGVSDTHEKQSTILEALTRKFTLSPDLSLRRVADRLPLTYTGADLYALCSDAMLKAITRKATAVDEKIKQLPGEPVSTAYFFDHLATPEDVAVMVTEDDFKEAQDELVPSVSAKELEHFERIRQTFESVDKQKQESGNSAPQTIEEVLEALKAGDQLEFSMDGPTTNGDSHAHDSGKGKGKQVPSGQSTSGKGKGKSPAGTGGKSKNKLVAMPNGDSDSSLDGPTADRGAVRGYEDVGEDDEDGVANGGDEDYIIRTDHLAQDGVSK